jgi:hypothetical protein
MKYLSALALLLLLSLNCATSFGQERELQLTASIINQQSCMINSGVDALSLTLQLRYTNTGNRKLILYKGNKLFYQVFVSHSKDDATHRNYELHTTHARYYDVQPEKIAGDSPGSVFAVLSPGASYETMQTIVVTVARESTGQFNVSVAPGEHVLNLIASTWYESKKLAQDLRDRWKARGFLWTDSVASNSVALVIDNKTATTPCK